MTSLERFINACNCRPVDRPPVWVMRQAGRYLPEYRAIRKKHSFLNLVKTPELAAEITLQPLKRFNFDAAILFSDILVIPEAMGQPYSFRDGGGIAMEYTIRNRADLARLDSSAVTNRLDYVFDAIRLVRKRLNSKIALIGFAGSPWTLATYMIEGGSSREFAATKHLYYTDRGVFNELMDRLTGSICQYLDGQIDAGVDTVQLFDSWGGALPGCDYVDASLRWIGRIIESIAGRVPVILYARNTYASALKQASFGIRVLSLDWTVDMAEARASLPQDLALQGNLDPSIMETTPEITKREATRHLESMRGAEGFIVNLGHPIRPQARPECVAALVDTVSQFQWPN